MRSLLPIVVLAACEAGAGVPQIPDGHIANGTERLAAGVTMELPRGAALSVAGTYAGSTGVGSVPIEQGQLVLSRPESSQLVVDVLRFDLGDTLVHAGHANLWLVGMTLRLEEPAVLEVVDHDVWAEAAGPATMTLDWSLATDAGAFPLQSVDLAAHARIVFWVDEQDRVSALVRFDRAGVFWDWAGVLELGDLQLALETKEAIIP